MFLKKNSVSTPCKWMPTVGKIHESSLPMQKHFCRKIQFSPMPLDATSYQNFLICLMPNISEEKFSFNSTPLDVHSCQNSWITLMQKMSFKSSDKLNAQLKMIEKRHWMWKFRYFSHSLSPQTTGARIICSITGVPSLSLYPLIMSAWYLPNELA